MHAIVAQWSAIRVPGFVSSSGYFNSGYLGELILFMFLSCPHHPVGSFTILWVPGEEFGGTTSQSDSNQGHYKRPLCE